MTFPHFQSRFYQEAATYRVNSNIEGGVELSLIKLSFVNDFYDCVSLGPFAGTVLGMPLSGLIAQRFGWPWVFYTFGKYLYCVRKLETFFL